MDELYVRVKGGGEICVSTEHSVTTYVLIEQEDWFEREIAFVRRLLQPGMRVIDIGANYGTYTLTMAQAVTPNGQILFRLANFVDTLNGWDPASTTPSGIDRIVTAGVRRGC